MNNLTVGRDYKIEIEVDFEVYHLTTGDDGQEMSVDRVWFVEKEHFKEYYPDIYRDITLNEIINI